MRLGHGLSFSGNDLGAADFNFYGNSRPLAASRHGAGEYAVCCHGRKIDLPATGADHRIVQETIQHPLPRHFAQALGAVFQSVL